MIDPALVPKCRKCGRAPSERGTLLVEERAFIYQEKLATCDHACHDLADASQGLALFVVELLRVLHAIRHAGPEEAAEHFRKLDSTHGSQCEQWRAIMREAGL